MVAGIEFRVDINSMKWVPADRLAMNDIAKVALKLAQLIFATPAKTGHRRLHRHRRIDQQHGRCRDDPSVAGCPHEAPASPCRQVFRHRAPVKQSGIIAMLKFSGKSGPMSSTPCGGSFAERMAHRPCRVLPQPGILVALAYFAIQLRLQPHPPFALSGSKNLPFIAEFFAFTFLWLFCAGDGRRSSTVDDEAQQSTRRNSPPCSPTER